MQFILDHISASLVGGTVLLILLVAQVRTGEVVVDQTSYYVAKTQLLNMNDMVEADFKNVGFGVPASTPVFNVVTDDATEFLRLLDPDDTNLATVRYELVPTDTLEIDEEEVPVFEVQRIVDGVLTGKTPASMIVFDVELRNVEGDPVADPVDAETVHVRYEMAMPFDTDARYLKKVHWTRTFLAPNL